MSIQSELKYPGLVVECEELLVKFGLGEKSPTSFSKEAWKRMTKRKVLDENRICILQEIKRYKKIDYLELKEEPFGTKNYFKTMNVKDARLRLRMRLKIVPGIKYHYKNDAKFKETLWSCDVCALSGEYSLDTLSHTFWCPGLSQYRNNRDLSLDADAVMYIKDVMKVRENLSTKEET